MEQQPTQPAYTPEQRKTDINSETQALIEAKNKLEREIEDKKAILEKINSYLEANQKMVEEIINETNNMSSESAEQNEPIMNNSKQSLTFATDVRGNVFPNPDDARDSNEALREASSR